MLRFAVAFAFMRARKLVRGLRQGLSEEERYVIADDVVHRLHQNGDPWRLSEELSDVTGKGYSTPPNDKKWTAERARWHSVGGMGNWNVGSFAFASWAAEWNEVTDEIERIVTRH
jgi:hypothetical protein